MTMCKYLCTLIILLFFFKVEAQFTCFGGTGSPTTLSVDLTSGNPVSITNFQINGCNTCTSASNLNCRVVTFSLPAGYIGVRLLFSGANGSIDYYVNDCSGGPIAFSSNSSFCINNNNQNFSISFCRPGLGQYDITATPLSGSVASFTGTTLSGCSLPIPAAAGQSATNIVWTNTSGNDPGLAYLSCTNCLNPTFSDLASAGTYIYQVCTDYSHPDCPGTPFTACRAVTVNVLAPPTITCPGDVTVACQAAVPAGATTLTAFQTAGGSTTNNGAYTGPGASVAFTDVPDGTACPIIITRTYTLTDSCGNVAMCEQSITVDPPPFTWISAPANTAISCASAAAFVPSGLMYTNGQSGPCASSGFAPPQQVRNFDECGGSIEVTWTYTDLCGRTINHMQTITVMPAPPATFAPPSLPLSLSCVAAVSFMAGAPPFLGYNNNGGSGSCLIAGSVQATVTDNFDACGGVIRLDWSFTDDCDRTIETYHIITIDPAPLPTWTSPTLPGSLTCEQALSYTPPDASYSNGLSGLCNLSGMASGSVTPTFTNCGGMLQITYNAADECNRLLQPLTLSIQINPAAQPVWINPPGNITITCAEAEMFTPGSADFSNGLAGLCAISGSVSGMQLSPAPSCGGTFTVVYNIPPVCPAILLPPHLQTVTVLPAPAPVLVNPPTDRTISCAEALTFIPVQVIYSNSASGVCLISGPAIPTVTPVFDSCGGTITVRYDATLPCSYAPLTYSQTVTVEPAPQPSWINAPADLSMSCEAAESYIPPNLAFSNNLPFPCRISGTAAPSITRDYDACGGTMTISWTYDVGCWMDTYTQTITVNPAAPAQFTAPPMNMSITCANAATYMAPNLNYSNGVGGVCIISGSVAPSTSSDFDACGGTVTVTWSFTDECGRTISHTQMLTVLPAPAPVWLGAPADITLSCNEATTYSPVNLNYSNASSASGACLIQGVAYPNESGSYDECGGVLTYTWEAFYCNASMTHTQRVTILPAPLAGWVNPPADITMTCSEVEAYVPGPLNYTNGAFDACLISGSVDPLVVDAYSTCGGSKTITWSFTDLCNRVITHTQTVQVVSASTPAFIDAPDDITIDCRDLYNFSPPDLTITNNESGICLITDVVSPVFAPVSGLCGGSFGVTWTYVNPCSRVTITHVQRVKVIAAPAPVFSAPPADDTITCAEAALFYPEAITYTNRDLYCLIEGTIAGKVTGSFDACGGEFRVTWAHKDDCGRGINHVQKITILPAATPTWWEIPEPETLFCDQADAYVDPGMKYTNMLAKGCLIEGTVKGKVTRNYNLCGGEMKVFYTYTDVCGRLLTHEHKITVIPNEKANWTSLPPKVTLTCEKADLFVGFPLSFSNRQKGTCLIEGSVMPTLHRNYSSCGGEIEAVWIYTDACGRTIECIHSYPVLPAPKVHWVNVPADLTLTCAEAIDYQPEHLSFTNGASGSCLITGQVEGVLSGTIDHTGGDLSVMWMYADTCNNFLMHQQKITVEAPGAPQWTSGLPQDITLSCELAEQFASDPLSFANNEEGPCLIAGEVLPTRSGAITNCGGELILDWYWTNGIHELAHQVKVTVTPPAAPQFTTLPEADTLSFGEALAFMADSLTFSNGASSACAILGTVAGVVDKDFDRCGGKIMINWSVTDRCDRELQYTQTIVVTPLAPIVWEEITLPDTLSTSEAEALLPLNRTFSNQDTGLAGLQGEVLSTLSRNYNLCGGTLVLEWNHMDECGRQTAVDHTIQVLEAPAAQWADLTLDSVMQCKHLEGYDLPELAYENGLEGRFSLTGTSQPLISIDSAACGGTLMATYRFTDDCNRTIERMYAVKLIDTLKPLLQGVPTDTIITCGTLPNPPGIGTELILTDNCIAAGVTFGEVTIPADTPGVTSYVRTWVARDACGNEVTYQQNIILRECSKAFTDLVVNLCAGETYHFNGQVLDRSGNYTTLLKTYDGGDSTVILTLNINSPIETTLTETICMGSAYNFNGRIVSVPGLYTANLASVNGCDSLVRLNLLATTDGIKTYKDVLLCAGENIQIGDRLVFEPGTISQTLTAAGGCDSTVIYRIRIEESPKLEVEDMEICPGQTVTLQIKNQVPGTLSWSSTDASLSCVDCPNPSTSPAKDAIYTVSTTGCNGELIEARLSVKLTSLPALNTLPDYVIGTNESVRVSLDKESGLISNLYDEKGQMICENCTQVTLSPRQSTAYMVKTINAAGCSLDRTFKVMVGDHCGLSSNSQINIISPNEDGINDLWEVINPLQAPIVDISIYNRQGERIFHSTRATDHWDGKYQQVPVPEGVYVYKISFKCGQNKLSYLLGDLTIVR